MSKKEHFEQKPDLLNDLIKVGAGFDWMTPLVDIVRGFNTIEFEGDHASCKKIEKELKKEGVTCRTQFVIDEGWRVIAKR